MPASPSFPSDGRGKWRKRKRDSATRRPPRDDNENDASDYELEENDADPTRNDDDPSDEPHPTAAAPDPVPAEVLDGGARHSDFPPVVSRLVNRPHASVLAIAALERVNHIHAAGDGKGPASPVVLENVSHGQLQALSAVPADSPALLDPDKSDGASSAYVITPPPIMEGRGVVKRYGNRVHVVPMHADWFSPTTVHRLERQVVPHFFSGKSPEFTPEMYMQCRNEIVAKYMENPEKKLTVSDCTNLNGHLSNEDLTRIVRFLDHWGIVNYSAVTPSPEPWNGNSYLREEINGEIHVPSAALKSIDSLIKFDKPRCRRKAAELYSSLSCHDDDDTSDLDDRIRRRLSENHCSYCSCSLPNVYYQSQKEVESMLCSNCFHEGRYVVGHSSIDFIRVDSTKDYSDLDGENWTDQETLLLLEAMEIYNENWNEIAEHVATKSKAQCILHFLRLPVEDGLLENIEVPGMPLSSNSSIRDDHRRLHSNSNGNSAGTCLKDGDSERRFPFANSGNPVMSLVAFLASSVGPRVAASCAHAALAELSKDNGLSASGNNLQTEGSGHRMNSENTHGHGGAHGSSANSVQQKEENAAGHGSRGTNEAGATLPAEKVQIAAEAGLAAAAIKAKLFADHEEREIQRLSANIVNHQLKRLELKLKQFAEVETYLMKECEQVEKTRQRMATERARLISTSFGPAGVASSIGLSGVGPSMANNNSGNNRQQIMSPSASQPSVSGYGNQPAHSHMPFIQQQSMLGLGPRMPLASIQGSTSTPNVMYNAPATSRPTLSHPMLRPVPGTSSGLG